MYIHVLIHGYIYQTVLPLTVPVYCFRTTPRHTTEFICGHVYWPCSVNSRACANSVYQALLSPPLEPGNEAKGAVAEGGPPHPDDPCRRTFQS